MNIFTKIRLQLFGNCPRVVFGYRCKGQECEKDCDWYKAQNK